MAEWLGNGLQNRVQRFESAWYLKIKPADYLMISGFLIGYNFRKCC